MAEKGNPTWKKGQSGNPAGRPKGSANKVAAEIRDKYADRMDEALGKAFALLGQIGEPAEYIDSVCKLAPYFLPKLKATELSVAPESDGLITVQFVTPDKS